jgi:hypothetical protein
MELDLHQRALATMVASGARLSDFDGAFAEVAVRSETVPLGVLWNEYVAAERWVQAYITDATIQARR